MDNKEGLDVAKMINETQAEAQGKVQEQEKELTRSDVGTTDILLNIKNRLNNFNEELGYKETYYLLQQSRVEDILDMSISEEKLEPYNSRLKAVEIGLSYLEDDYKEREGKAQTVKVLQLYEKVDKELATIVKDIDERYTDKLDKLLDLFD